MNTTSKLGVPILQALLKNRGVEQGRSDSKNNLLAKLAEHEQAVVEIEKLTTAGAVAELALLGQPAPKGAKVDVLRALVAEAQQQQQQKRAAEEAEQAEQAAQAAQAAKEAEQAAKEPEEAEEVAEQAEQAEPEPAPKKDKKLSKRKRKESGDYIDSPAKITKAEIARMSYRGQKKKGPTFKQQHESDHRVYTAEGYMERTIGKKGGKKHRLELDQNALLLQPKLGKTIKIGFRVAVPAYGSEDKTLTWIELAHVLVPGNRRMHPGIKEAAKSAWVPSTTIAEQEQRAAVAAAFNGGAQQHLQQQADGSDSDSGSDSDV